MSNFAHSNPFHILFGQRERPENVSLNPASHILTSFVDSAESSDFYQGLKNTCSLSTDYLQYMDTVKGIGGTNLIALNVKQLFYCVHILKVVGGQDDFYKKSGFNILKKINYVSKSSGT